jgi:hypothetical protein
MYETIEAVGGKAFLGEYIMGIGAIITIIVAMVLGFAGFILLLVNKWIKNDHEIEKLKLQKETAEIEMEKMGIKMKLLEEENRKYDKIINENSKSNSMIDNEIE